MPLDAGQPAPDFIAKDQDGQEIRLADFKGKKLALYFYPRDNTKGCTAQACNLRDHYQELLDAGYQVMGVSTDDENSHQKFIQKYDLPFPLIADTDQSMVRDYDVWKEKNMYGKKFMGIQRTTYIIDEEGNIEQVIKKPKTAEHTAQILG